MTNYSVSRRLVAILAGDMAGYSRLMEADEEDVLARQKQYRRELIDPAIDRSGGNIVKLTGDGMLVEFPNALDAVRCAMDIQRAMLEREGSTPEDHRIQYRIGVNLGDVLFEEGDIFGDAVNVAARLEGLAKPGSICVSDIVHQLIADRLEERFQDLGTQRIKNISRQVRVWQWSPRRQATFEPAPEVARSQQIKFCLAGDGTQIAYSSVGQGPPILKAPNYLNHLDYEWRSPVWGPIWREFAKHYHFVRFDQRGNGLSDWDVEDISDDAMIDDMAAVADAAALHRFALFGISQGCAFSVRYAVEHPDRVACLILLGGYARGRLKRGSREQQRMFEATCTMIRQGWGSPNPAFRNFFTDSYMPDATPEQTACFDELQRITTNSANAERIWRMIAQLEVSDLARQVQVPAIVLHCRDDRMIPIAEGRRLAALIPNATFVELDGANHALIEGTPAFEQFFAAARPFLDEHSAPPTT